MCNVQNIGVLSMLFYFLWFHVLLVTDARLAYYRKMGSASEKVTMAASGPDTNARTINSTLSTSGHVLVKSGHNKNVTKEKAVKKDVKWSKVSKDTKNQKSSIIKKLNVTKGDLRSTKGSLRLGKPYKDIKWPNIQKHGLRDKELGSTRVTRMNMMQMGDSTPFAGAKELTVQNDSINEVLSPYTIKEQMIRIGAKFNNVNVTVEVLGRTLEYNDIVIMKMTKMNEESGRFRADDQKYIDETNAKKIIFIVHGLSVMGMISVDCLVEEKHFVHLVSYYLEHLDKFDIFLMPMANPDGFGSEVQIWNKNNSPQEACAGVALDRNFDIGWNGSRVVSSCSQQYPGPAPFSEPETRAVRDVLHRYSHKIIAYIHVHAGMYSDKVFKGDAVLYPKGYTDIQSEDDKYIDLKGEIDEMMRKANFQVYSVTVDTLHSWYGRVAGTSVDYASSVYGIPYAMEFVMQLYSDDANYKKISEERFSYNVLVEVWRRVIDVVANNIWNTLHSNEL